MNIGNIGNIENIGNIGNIEITFKYFNIMPGNIRSNCVMPHLLYQYKMVRELKQFKKQLMVLLNKELLLVILIVKILDNVLFNK